MKIKREKILLKNQVYHNDYYVYKKHYNRDKRKLDPVKKKKFDYKRLKLSDDYNYKSDN